MRRPFLLLLVILPVCLSLAPRRPFLPGPGAPAQDLRSVPHRSVPSDKEFLQLARTDPIAMFEASLARYSEEVDGYRCTLVKRERISEELKEEEEIRANFLESPFSVTMRWLRGAGRAEATLYVRGENDNQIVARPSGMAARFIAGDTVLRGLDDPLTRGASRFGIDEFGIAKSMARTYSSWSRAQEQGRLFAEYLGVQPVAEVNGRLCHIWKRHCDPPEEDGLTDVTIAIDTKTWLQISSELKRGDELIAYYHFRDLELNPEFEPGTFEPRALAQP